MVNYPVADFLTRIKNGYLARKESIVVPYTKMTLSLADILLKHGYIGKVERINKKEKEKKHSSLLIKLIYQKNLPRVTDIKIASKPGRRVYIGHKEIKSVLGGMGLAIISTPKGLKTDKEAKKEKLGGELICHIW